ncbi:MAG TPA: hypothetical protein VNB24_09080 [Acidimicrobiales bacterium]|nr:hypothetical protein [Acidimicrobiales bacterium]
MVDGFLDHFRCGECGHDFADDPAAVALDRAPCPGCGSTTRTGTSLALVTTGFRVSTYGEGRPEHRGRRRWFVRWWDNLPSWHRTTGVWASLSRTIDKRHDRYED